MKHTKKLIPAIGMLLLSACMLVTSTFAWFSMNETVTATGMTVAAKGDQIYLQIKKEQFADSDNGKKIIDIDFAAGTIAELFPAAVMKTTTDPYTTGSSFIWVSAKGKDAQVGTKEGAYTEVDDSAIDDYRVEKSMYIRLDPSAGAAAAEKPLKVSGVSFVASQTVNDMAKCISVMVVGDGCAQLFKYNATAGKFEETAGDGKLTSAAFAEKSTGLEVNVYIFFDGDNDLCTLESLAEAKATGAVNKYAIDISFTCA